MTICPETCPHCLADFARDGVEIKTSNPPKCGRCWLPLSWVDRATGQEQEWPCAVVLRGALRDFKEFMDKLDTIIAKVGR